MSIEGSLALAGVLLLGIGVATSAYCASASKRDGSFQSPGPGGISGEALTSRPGWVAVALLVAGAVLLLIAGLLLIALWTILGAYL